MLLFINDVFSGPRLGKPEWSSLLELEDRISRT